jgi:hypothetical protein
MFSGVRVIRAASLPEHLSSPKCLVANDTYLTKHLGELRFSGREAARMTRTSLNIWMNSDALVIRAVSLPEHLSSSKCLVGYVSFVPSLFQSI